MTAVFEPCDEGGFIAYVQEISGINTQGETLEEVKENLADAVNLVFGKFRKQNNCTLILHYDSVIRDYKTQQAYTS